MGNRLVLCKVFKTQVNKESRCPDQNCDTCPEVQTVTKGTARPPTFSFTELERKVFEKKDIFFAVRVYNFLKDFITNPDEVNFIKYCCNFFKLIDYLKKQNLYLRLEGNEFEAYIKNLYWLYALIKRKGSKKQGNSIPLDCLLICYCCNLKKPNIGALAEYLQKEQITDLDVEGLQKRMIRARSTTYLLEITGLAIKLMPEEHYEALSSPRITNSPINFLI